MTLDESRLGLGTVHLVSSSSSSHRSTSTAATRPVEDRHGRILPELPAISDGAVPIANQDAVTFDLFVRLRRKRSSLIVVTADPSATNWADLFSLPELCAVYALPPWSRALQRYTGSPRCDANQKMCKRHCRALPALLQSGALTHAHRLECPHSQQPDFTSLCRSTSSTLAVTVVMMLSVRCCRSRYAVLRPLMPLHDSPPSRRSAACAKWNDWRSVCQDLDFKPET